MFLILLIFINLILISFADVTLYKYNPTISLKYNNFKLRETLNSQYFAYPGYHKFDFPINYTTNYFSSNKYFFGSALSKDYYINKKTLVASINYYYDKSHYFDYILNLVLSDNGVIYINHNNKLIYSKYSKSISIYNNTKLSKGYHSFKVYIDGNNICNCPSYKDGYQQTRYFFGWITPIKKSNNTILLTKVTNLPIVEKILKYSYLKLYKQLNQ